MKELQRELQNEKEIVKTIGLKFKKFDIKNGNRTLDMKSVLDENGEMTDDVKEFMNNKI